MKLKRFSQINYKEEENRCIRLYIHINFRGDMFGRLSPHLYITNIKIMKIMKIRRKLYSDSNPKRKHLKFRDMRRLLKDKYLRSKKSRDNEIEMLETGKIGKSVKHTAKRVFPITIGAGAVGGALVNRLDKDFRALPKKNRIAIGVISGATGALIHGNALGGAIVGADALNKKIKVSKNSNKKEKRIDQLKMANREITKQEFIDKYYN